MVNYTLTLNPVKRSELGEYKSTFLELAFGRYLTLRDQLLNENTPEGIRLLYLKDIFSVFEEIDQLGDIKAGFGAKDEIDLIFRVVKFVRNLLLHFPIFETWDQIYISANFASELAPKGKGGSIAKFLTDYSGAADMPFTLEYCDHTLSSSINFSAIRLPDEITFLKDIISEHDVIHILLELIQYTFTAKAR